MIREGLVDPMRIQLYFNDIGSLMSMLQISNKYHIIKCHDIQRDFGVLVQQWFSGIMLEGMFPEPTGAVGLACGLSIMGADSMLMSSLARSFSAI